MTTPNPQPAPYYADEFVTLYHGDFRDVLPWITHEADVIITDPPYGETSLDWDRWPPNWPEYLSGHGKAMWCFGSLRMFMEHASEFASWKLSQDVIMEKHNGSSLAVDRFRRVHEQPAFFYRGKWSDIYFDVPKTNDATPRTVRRKALPPQHQGARGASVYRSEDGGPRIMRSVIPARSMHGMGTINETEKNPLFVELLVQSACPPGGIVLDIFAGSGSTGVAARALGCRAVLIEKRESQCEAAAARLANATLDFTAGAS